MSQSGENVVIYNLDKIYLTIDYYNNVNNISIIDVLTFLAVFCAILVIVSKNPIISVLFLIGLFMCIAFYLMAIGLTFIGLSYLLVYVGAISILFLFILMLINIRISELLSETRNSVPLLFTIPVLFAAPLSLNLSVHQSVTSDSNSMWDIINNYLLKKGVKNTTNGSWDDNIIDFSHITSIGNIMYSSYALFLIITSMILLLAMVGAIVITIKNETN